MAIYKWGILKHSVFNVLNFKGWIQLIYDKITLIYCVENEFHPTSEVQIIENGMFQNTPFQPFSKRGLQLPLGLVMLANLA